MTDIDELERLAKDAGGQPWVEDGYVIFRDEPGGAEVVGRVSAGSALSDEIADFMAAAHPAAVLALIAEVRRLREVNAQLSERGTLLYAAAHYADSVCGMLRQGGWPVKAEALEGRIKAVIDFDAARAKDSK